MWRRADRTKLMGMAGLVVALLMLLGACGGEEGGGTPSPTPPPATAAASPSPPPPTLTPGAYAPEAGTDNVFGNPGFEEDRTYWFSLKPPDYRLSEVAHSGQASALLHMAPPFPEPPFPRGKETDAKVYYLVQEVAPEEFPEIISGYYRVENWKRGTEKQYLQFVVIVWGAQNMPDPQFPNYQVAYILTGIDREPFPIRNRKFVFLGGGEPRMGEWLYFQANVKEDFQELWGAVPEGYSKIRVLFEVRYDDRTADETEMRADVYYDDLYMGPAAANPNQ